VYCTFDDSSPGTLDAGQIERIRACPGVVLHPPTREPALALAGAHAAILPSRAGEGVSKFVLEALACGRPVLISAESGSGEVIEAGVTGLVFPAQDTAAIRGALVEIGHLGDDDYRRMSTAARTVAEQRYSLDVILPRIVELHRRLAGVSV